MGGESEPSSWAEMVQGIERDKRSLGWNPGDVKPVERVNRCEVRPSLPCLLSNHFLSHSILRF